MQTVRAVFIVWCGVLPLYAAGNGVPVRVFGHTPGLRFTGFTDPRENAFSAEVPRGWKTEGGLFRFAPVDTRPALVSVSPEGDARISLGDADLPPFTVPNQMLAMAGFREGSWYSPGYGIRMLVKRYEPGAAFAEDYVTSKLAPQIGCSGLSIAARNERGDLTRAINAIYARYAAMGINTREDAGEVSFTCTRNGRPWRGYYLVTTSTTGGYGGAVWHAERILGYAAAAEQAGLAQAAMARLAASIRVSPEWLRMQAGVTMATSQIVAETNQQISGMIRTSFAKQWQSQSEVFRHDANARRGTTDVRDPETGETWTVQSGSRHYWHKPGSDGIVGTQTYDSPGVGYEAVEEY